MQGTPVWFLFWEHSTCRGATKPMNNNYWADCPRARAQQQEEPLRWEANAPQLESNPHSPKLEKPTRSNEDQSSQK